MALDLTTQLQPALWGLVIALLASATALLAATDRDEMDVLWRYRDLRQEWRRRLSLFRGFCEQQLGRLVHLTHVMVERATRNLTLGGKTN